MVDLVTTTAIVTYESNMVMALQPRGGDLIGACLTRDLSGELAELDDIFGAVDTETIRDRHVPIIPTEGSQDRLWLAKPDPDYFMRLVNSQDKLMAGVDIQGGYTMQGSAAIRRYWDRQWINGFFAGRQTGKKGTIVSAFPSGQVIPTTRVSPTAAHIACAWKSSWQRASCWGWATSIIPKPSPI
jgi:hypothetical protein